MQSCAVSNAQSINHVYSIPKGAQKLLNAYSNQLRGFSHDRLIWKDGTQMIYDQHKRYNNFEAELNNPDLKVQMSKNYDLGRIRYAPFFEKIYGKTKSEVQSKLVPIIWLPKTEHKRFLITSVNGVNKQLQAVSDELDKLPNRYKKYITHIGGTFNWRYIHGTHRLSPHSFGIAIDINVKNSDYWRWEIHKRKQAEKMPQRIISIFKKHDFIWGGNWHHYDTMHFEYRPELLGLG